MSHSADVFRQRAEHLIRVSSAQTIDPDRRKICRTIAAAYQALANNEEWLEGEQPPQQRGENTASSAFHPRKGHAVGGEM